MKKIPFTIDIINKNYNGSLVVNDFSKPPNNYLVFMENHMVGELMRRHEWTFTQGRRHKILGKLSNRECDEIAECLGSIADLVYKGEMI